MEQEGQLTGQVTRAALEAHLARSPKPAAAAREELADAGGKGGGEDFVALDLREALNLAEVSPFAFGAADDRGGR